MACLNSSAISASESSINSANLENIVSPPDVYFLVQRSRKSLEARQIIREVYDVAVLSLKGQIVFVELFKNVTKVAEPGFPNRILQQIQPLLTLRMLLSSQKLFQLFFQFKYTFQDVAS